MIPATLNDDTLAKLAEEANEDIEVPQDTPTDEDTSTDEDDNTPPMS